MEKLDLELFPNDSYTTKSNSRILIDKLFLNTRFYFVIKYIQLIFKSRKLARIGKYNRKAWSLSSFDVFKLIESCGGRFNIEGIDNIRNCKEPVVIISNHMSAMESMILPALIAPFKEVTFVVKESLPKHFLFGPVISARNPITVGRLNSREDLISVMKQGKENLEKGVSIIIFPQGGRRNVFKPEEFNSLGVKLAKSSGVKAIPVALKTDFWGNGKIIKDFGTLRRKHDIYITIEKPVEITGNGKEQNDQIIQFISTSLDDWKKS
ncbi:MAG: 1-acyl-sn-glycerol-3-phosphate acyltransferase [Bacteroidales bacterium]|nr:1-acyl-sn-glycerol-3-phosphate acyltransferase [Bacteroidales bacterium]